MHRVGALSGAGHLTYYVGMQSTELISVMVPEARCRDGVAPGIRGSALAAGGPTTSECLTNLGLDASLPFLSLLTTRTRPSPSRVQVPTTHNTINLLRVIDALLIKRRKLTSH